MALLLPRGITRTALHHAVSYVLNEVAALHRNHSFLTLPVVPSFSVRHDPRSAYVSHWTAHPTSLMCTWFWALQTMEAPGWPHSALLQVLSIIVSFSVHVTSTVACHRDLATHRLRLPMQHWWVGPDSQRREVQDVDALLWDSAAVTPPPPWDTARCFWVLGYGHPECTIALYAPHARA